MSSVLVFVVAAHAAAAVAVMALANRRRAMTVVAAAPLVTMFGWALWAIGWGGVLDGVPIAARVSWIPALGVSFDVRVDALAALFLALISGIGAAIVVFSHGYMAKASSPGRFAALLVLFAGAMSGLVVVDNVFGFFVFWELTTITSYLLVGFDDEKGSARAAALQAILTTGLGGLALLGGLVILSQAAGTTSIAAIVESAPGGAAVGAALLLVFLGAFTKSAQAPFHFWLPGAMSAPTPASAYLHSATMVKAGIFILLRLAPGYGDHVLWTPTVATVGLVTMLIGAWRAMRQTDLKLLLAYGTVSQLGFMVALIGIGTASLLHAAVAVVVGHALFKSALFLTVGAIDMSTGTRDIRVLSGLGRRLRVLATAAALAAASMAGIPPLAGFVTKEAAFAALIDSGRWIALAVIAAASVVTVAYSARMWWGAFSTEPVAPDADPSGVAASPLRAVVTVPVVVLSLVGLVLGLVPSTIDPVVGAVAEGGKLVLWPGLKPALAVSVIVMLIGALVHLRRDAFGRAQDRIGGALTITPAFSAEGGYRWAIGNLNRVADRVTGFVQNGSLPVYLAVILSSTVGVPVVAWAAAGGSSAVPTWGYSFADVALAVLAIATAIAVTRAESRMVSVLLLGSVGYAMAGMFVVYGAPDLALTLLLVETITVAVFAFVLTRLPRRFEMRTWRVARAVRIAVAVGVGTFVTGASLVASHQRVGPSFSEAYVDLAPAEGGTNVVNVILTDFRALDTLGEITVVAVAAIGVAALVGGLARTTREPS